MWFGRAGSFRQLGRREIGEEFDDVGFAYNIIFAFEAESAGGFCAFPAFVGDKIAVRDDAGFDKAFFKIGMDYARGLGSFGSVEDGPGAEFFVVGCKHSYKA